MDTDNSTLDELMPEVIITSGKTCGIYDAGSGNHIKAFKDDNHFSPKTLSLIGSDYLIGAYSNKPMLKVWTISKQKKQEVASFVVPGLVSTLAISNCGNYCVAAIKEQIYVWEVSTGELINILSRHYQEVSCLKFTADDSRFISGGSDGHVFVWVLSCVVDVNARHDTVKPLSILSAHSREVTDIYIGFSVSRVATTSLDMTCKIHELDSGILLTTIVMGVELMAVVMDPLEYYVFLGDDGGCVYKINTYEKMPHEIHRADVNNKAALKLHEAQIISLSISFDGKSLMTSSADGMCKLWNIESMTCQSTIFVEGGISNAFLAIKPPCLDNKEAVVPDMCIRSFQKDLYSSNTDKKYIETRIQPKDLSLMYDGCPDKYYPSALFCRTGTKAENINVAVSEENFQEAIHGETLSHLTTMNQQMYTVLVGDNFDNRFGRPPSPS